MNVQESSPPRPASGHRPLTQPSLKSVRYVTMGT